MGSVKAGYICKMCGEDTFDVEVREKVDSEDIVNYVHHVGRKCGEHHAKNHPFCLAENVDLKLPISANGIGKIGRQLTPEEMADLKKNNKL